VGIVEFFQLMGAALKDLGSYFSSSLIELVGGILALVVFSVKAYQVGREQITKKFRPFIIGDSGFWDKPPTRSIYKHQQALKKSVPILTIVNFKGGVGKSTVAANLAAFYDDCDARVLLIDLDYQGSLTDTTINRDELSFGTLCLMDPDFTSDEIPTHFVPATDCFTNTKVLASNYKLLEEESRALFRWIVGDTKKDIRYLLNRFLQSVHVQAHFDLVIIDASPRITTASVNALCASTHVIIPTMLDGTAATAALNTVSAVHKLKKKLSPSLNLLGVLPTFVDRRTGYSPRELNNLSFLTDEIQSRFPDERVSIFHEERILRRAAIASAAGNGAAYFHDAEIREMFDKLGRRIAAEVSYGWLRTLADETERDDSRASGDGGNVITMGR